MLNYVIKRLLGLIPTLLIVAVLVFLFVHMLPGDPARLIASAERAAEVLGWTARADIDSIIASAWSWHSRNPEGFAE